MFGMDHLLIGCLITLNIIYVYILSFPVETDVRHKNFVIKDNTIEAFQQFLLKLRRNQNTTSGSRYKFDDDDDFSLGRSSSISKDDFYLNDMEPQNGFKIINQTIIPSADFICVTEKYLTFRSQENYKYLNPIPNDKEDGLILESFATFDSLAHSKAFELIPVNGTCNKNSSEGGWVHIKSALSPSFFYMKCGNNSAVDKSDAWTIKSGTSSQPEAAAKQEYWFLLEKEGYILNRACMAFINVFFSPDKNYLVRGHGSGRRVDQPANREYSAEVEFRSLSKDVVIESMEQAKREDILMKEEDDKHVKTIAGFPTSAEKRIISFGLYGANPKYTNGAIRNAEMKDTYFPGWVCRFYVTSDVPKNIIDKLKLLGSEIADIPDKKGYTAGMFYRFLVAVDATVDRYIIRDADSRLNSRDRFAVEEWIESKAPIHVQRDHVNHCSVPLNGGMWGGVKGALPQLLEDIEEWKSKDLYAADLDFLKVKVWPKIKSNYFSHDSYCCDRFPNTHPYPSKRNLNYQHVGQVFDGRGNPRMSDIEGFIRGVPVPSKCRKYVDWIYG